MMLPVSSVRPAPRPVDLLRASSEQIRRAADLLAEIAGETETPPPADPAPEAMEPDELRARHQRTILLAQRSFVASLRLEQLHERPEPLDHLP